MKLFENTWKLILKKIVGPGIAEKDDIMKKKTLCRIISLNPDIGETKNFK